MKKMLFIMNPYSGKRKANRYLVEILELFNRAGYRVVAHMTAGQGDATEVARELGPRMDLVVCCGGDGTFNETVSGVLKSGKALPIGYIPAGSTNDFAASLHLSSNLLQAARDITQGTAEYVDVGRFGDRYFSYVASFGAFTRTSYTTPQGMKNILGHAAYVLSGIQELSQLRSYPLRFTLADGTVIDDRFIFGAISNTTSVGGILTLSSQQVNMSDGEFELLLIRAPKDLLELSECVRALQQKTYNSTMITFVNTSRAVISAPKDMPWTLDGEQESGHNRVEVACLQHAIRVYQNRNTP